MTTAPLVIYMWDPIPFSALKQANLKLRIEYMKTTLCRHFFACRPLLKVTGGTSSSSEPAAVGSPWCSNDMRLIYSFPETHETFPAMRHHWSHPVLIGQPGTKGKVLGDKRKGLAEGSACALCTLQWGCNHCRKTAGTAVSCPAELVHSGDSLM